ncbi:MAG TPA: hypothetical protein PLR99_05795 [Polyangiaceae bacterium]|nr:hypothetical protein [Polyangiaceae bacterium]
MKKIRAGVLASAVVGWFVVSAAPGCSSTPAGTDAGAAKGVDCSANKCSADPAPTDAEKKACEDEKAGACGSEYNTAGSCVNGKVTCGADNKTDQASALKAISDCATEIKAYSDCKGKNPGTDGGK